MHCAFAATIPPAINYAQTHSTMENLFRKKREKSRTVLFLVAYKKHSSPFFLTFFSHKCYINWCVRGYSRGRKFLMIHFVIFLRIFPCVHKMHNYNDITRSKKIFQKKFKVLVKIFFLCIFVASVVKTYVALFRRIKSFSLF